MQPRRAAVPSRLLARLVVVLLACWLLWPQHAGGYGLGHDMVFTPHQPLNADSVGLGSSSPRAVPLDALVALASRLANGAVVGRLALLLPLLAAGWGAIGLLAEIRPAPRLPALLLAGGLAVWNPYLVERLALGQWALLWAYGALPWLVRAAHRIRAGRAGPADWAALFCWLAACSITPTGALIGAAVALVVGWVPGRRAVGLLVAGLLVQLPWLLPALLSSAAATSDPRAVAAFAARSERPGGTVLSLLGLGGIWSSDVTPASRAGLLGYLSTAAVLVALLAGIRLLGPPALRARLLWLAAAGLLLAAAATVPGLSAVLRWAVRELPGAGLLRDGQKWLMPLVLLVVLAAGLALDRLAAVLATPRTGQASQASQASQLLLAVAAMVVPLLLLPDGPATLRVPLTPVHYPADWQLAADRLAGTGSQLLVLPFASYRSFDWAPGRTVIDPAPRLLPAAVVVDDRLAVSGTVLAGEDRTAAAIGQLLASNPAAGRLAGELAGRGIGWVLVEGGTPGPPLPDLSALRLVQAGPVLRLYQVPGPIAGRHRDPVAWLLVIAADLLLALLLLAAIAVAAYPKTGSAARRLLHSPVTTTPEDH